MPGGIFSGGTLSGGGGILSGILSGVGDFVGAPDTGWVKKSITHFLSS